MSLQNALQIGRSSLLNSQTALETVGNNLANAATPGYHRQRVDLAPLPGQQIDRNASVGRGVQLQAITRQVDEALETRLRSSIADQSGSQVREQWLSRIEAIYDEYGEGSLSSRLNQFFDAWDNLANQPEDPAQRNLVLQEARSLTQFLQQQHTELASLGKETNKSLDNAVQSANGLLQEIEDLNQRIVGRDKGTGSENGLRDRRDQALSELSQYLDISTRESDTGVVDIYVGSEPIMINGQSRPLALETTEQDGSSHTRVQIADDGSPLDIHAGEIGQTLRFRQNDLPEALDALDDFTHQLAWQVNRVHSQGQGIDLHDSITGNARIAHADAPLNSNEAGLNFKPGHGSLDLHLTQKSTGQRTAHNINLNLDASDSADRTSLNDLIDQINAIDDVSASTTPDGRLHIDTTNNDFQISFDDDSSGVLAALGINTFFTGSDATDIAVDQSLANNPQLVAAGQAHAKGDNRNAQAIAALRDAPLDDLQGQSLTGQWRQHVEDYASRGSQARNQVESDTAVRENLEARQQSVSGVNPDEEAIDLIRFQRNYQASARFLSVVDEMMQTLLGMV